MPWKDVKANALTVKQLDSFSGGVAVEFVNEDYFDGDPKDSVFMELRSRLGSDENVSSVISIRSESGSSSSQTQKEQFERLKNTDIVYRGKTIRITDENYNKSGIRLERPFECGIGNDKWTGFLYVSIRGGQHQQNIMQKQSHEGCSFCIFNPACEYACEEVCLDIDLVMSYYALVSYGTMPLESKKRAEYNDIMAKLREALKESLYDHDDYKGDLLTYCDSHPCLRLDPGNLTDPIQVETIDFMDFSIDQQEDPRNIDFAHNEAANKGKYYWDREKKMILSAARPTNVYWARHLSNMMQQNFSLDEYFAREKMIVERRAEMLSKNQKTVPQYLL